MVKKSRSHCSVDVLGSIPIREKQYIYFLNMTGKARRCATQLRLIETLEKAFRTLVVKRLSNALHTTSRFQRCDLILPN